MTNKVKKGKKGMTNEEAIKYLLQLYPNGGHSWLDEQRIEAIGMAIKALQKEPVSEDLEEAANNAVIALVPSFGQKYSDGSYVSSCIDCFNREELLGLFKAGAKWQKERIMANSTNATIGLPYENKDGGYTHLIDVSRPLSVGNNIIAIIFKED